VLNSWLLEPIVLEYLLPSFCELNQLLEITGDYWRLLEITGDYWRLLEITGDYWRLLKITGDYWVKWNQQYTSTQATWNL